MSKRYSKQAVVVHRTEKMSEIIARQILEDVVARGLPPGAMLPAEALMLEQYGVGRPSLREALRILEVLGLIRVRTGPGGGPSVADAPPSTSAVLPPSICTPTGPGFSTF